MKPIKFLNIKGTLLDENQLQNYFQKMAAEHILQKESNTNTYPIPRLKDNFIQITKTYEFLNQNLKLGIHIHPAGEWLLDNYYVIEETYKIVKKELSLKKYKHFVGLSNKEYKGFARIYVLATEMVAYTEGNLDGNKLKELLQAYQNKKMLGMEEIWNITLFLDIALIEQIRNICEKIYFVQIQKYKVESMIERLVENKKEEVFIYKKTTQNIKLSFSKEPFIEYLSYRLNQYGKKSLPFVNILEEQVEKTGTTVAEIIKKEHFDIAIKKITMGNSIKSMKELQRTNLAEIFEEVNGVEEILKKDPMHIYNQMTHESKEYYRNQIKQLSKKTKISELYIASKALELAEKQPIENERKRHIGYYIIDRGWINLKKELGLRESFRDYPEKKARIYVSCILIITSFLDLLLSILFYQRTEMIVYSISFLLFFYIPASEIVIKIIQYILSKIVKLKRIPKMDFSQGIPKEATTMVVVPAIIKTEEDLREVMKKLEVYYIANQSSNLYFTLLGDCTASSREKEEIDAEIIEAGKQKIQELNQKYTDSLNPIFHFVYRRRVWNNKENCYLGWERKRGFLYEWNCFLLGEKKNTFAYNSWENRTIPEIQYVITLDSDTNLVLESAEKLIGAMAHPLNIPKIDPIKNIVIEGYGILQPRIGIDIHSSRKTLFTKIYAGMGGTDAYANAISDVYQDNFEEGIFAGKGIYHLKVFHQVLKNAIPENTVLSHDLLEGNYVRCGLITDVTLLDSYPTKWNSYMARLSRWTRGDWQIIEWLKKTVKDNKGNVISNPINELGKYKIIDNLRRSLLEITQILCFFLLFLNKENSFTLFYGMVLISIFIDCILDFLNTIIFKKEGVKKQSSFENKLPGLRLNIVRTLVNFSSIIQRAIILTKAIVVTLYRVLKSKEHLLEWTTAEEAEKKSKENFIDYLKDMWPNLLAGSFILIDCIFTKKWWCVGIGVLWMISPWIVWYISKKIKKESSWEQLNNKEQLEILKIAKDTWQYFEDFLKPENHYLPTDNYQEGRKPTIVERTSSTNIGLAMLSVISAYDLKIINLEKALDLLQKILETIQQLPKWNGHLYNWYDVKTLQPLRPQYVSTVDSGNFVGYLMVVKIFLEEIKDEKQKEKYFIKEQLSYIQQLIEQTDFSKLYNPHIGLFSIGFHIEENKLTESYYDLLASEARQASLIAIAKKDVPAKHWSRLSRVLTTLQGKKGLVSWSGTAFEYLMPNMIIRNYKGSLLEESCRFMILLQKKYCEQLKIPWGISEAAFNLKDLNANYQYKAFGIPWLGLKRGLSNDIVVSSYGSILAIVDEPKEVIQNLKKLRNYPIYGKYGLYESIDFTPDRLRKNSQYEVVKTYMAHHQGLILLAINNLVNENILQSRFHKNTSIQAIDILLQERLPEDVIFTKEKKEKIEKIKYNAYDTNYYVERIKGKEIFPRWNVLSNENYVTAMKQDGTGFSQYKGIQIYRYKKTENKKQGICFYFKNIKTGEVWSSYSERNTSEYKVVFTADKNEIIMRQYNVLIKIKTFILSNQNMEVRHIEIENLGNEEQTIEVSSVMEPVLSTENQDYAHKAFNNLFLKFEKIESGLLVQRNLRGNSEKIFMAVGFYCNQENAENWEYEIDKEKLYGRLNEKIPGKIKSSTAYSNQIGLVVDPIVSFRKTIKIKKSEKIKLNYILSISNQKEEAIHSLETFKNFENVQRNFEIVKIRNEETARYLQIKGKEMMVFQKLLSYILEKYPLKEKYLARLKKGVWKQDELWKYGISGDHPIILIKIKDINQIHVIKELLKAYIFFQNKGISIDFVIWDKEKNVYERYVREEIEREIADHNLVHFKNHGIYVFNEKDIDDIGIFYIKAAIVLEADMGSVESNLIELEEEYQKNIAISPLSEELEEETIFEEFDIKSMGLQYCNGFGGFSKDGKEYILYANQNVPSVWCNILANENFGTILTQNLGGYTWYKNSRLNRLTRWSNDMIEDTPSEEIFIQDITDKKFWRLGKGNMLVMHGRGYSKFEQNKIDMKQKLDVFVSMDKSVKINLFRLKNNTNHTKKINVLYKVDSVLEEDEIKSEGNLDLTYQANENLLYQQNLISNGIPTISYIYSSEKIESYTGNQKSFCPSLLEKLKKENSLGKSPCMVIQITIELKPFEEKEISFILGACEKIGDWQLQFKDIDCCKKEFQNTKKYWETLLEKVRIKTPDESWNILLNGWVIYQTISSRLYAKSGFYQSGGAWGFRDQLQDVLSLLLFDSQKVKEQILKHASHQFLEGDVEHWWHEETKRGIRTKFSDDRLWLAYVLIQYIKFTGDKDILEIKVPYLTGNILQNQQDEDYDIHMASKLEESLYQHCLKAIAISLSFGKNNLPLIGSGDWNDGLSTVGNKGKGESVWLGFFLYYILEEWIPILEEKGEEELIALYKEKKAILKKALNQNGWDGRWYRRAFTDDNKALGSIENKECKIDSISQSWSVISDAAENDKKYMAMDSLEKNLILSKPGIIKLLDPPFESSDLHPGYIQNYLPGVRENGGQYTHAAIWATIAFAKLKLEEKAYPYLQMLNPIEHSNTKEKAEQYKIEPYVIAADIYGSQNLLGRGGWSWYTGSSSWYYIAGIQEILGLTIEREVLSLHPCVPKEWKEYFIQYKYGDSIYNIKVKNTFKTNTVQKFICDGIEIKEKKMKLMDHPKIYEIEITI